MTEDPAPYGNLPKTDFESQFRRLIESAECRTQNELAALLEVPLSAVSNAKRRKIIPADWLAKLLEKKHINPEWVYTGLGGKAAQPADKLANKRFCALIGSTEYKAAKDCTTEELLA